MPRVAEPGTVEVHLAVTVHVDATDSVLVDLINASSGALSIEDIVRGEIESNLESVSYVRWAQVE